MIMFKLLGNVKFELWVPIASIQKIEDSGPHSIVTYGDGEDDWMYDMRKPDDLVDAIELRAAKSSSAPLVINIDDINGSVT